jgi:glycosyltransferase involved in cell wall biosynthesis
MVLAKLIPIIIVSIMANLLCISNNPEDPYADDHILGNLIPRWGEYFKDISVWPISKASNDSFKKLGERLQAGEWTHVLIHAPLPVLDMLSSIGICQDRLPGVLLYAYAQIDSQFVDIRYIDLPARYDFFITPSPMADAAMKGLLVRSNAPKDIFKASKNILVMPIGINTEVFRPLNIHAGEPGKEEIRQIMFEGKISGSDFMVMVSGRPTIKKGIPEAMATIRCLRDKYDKKVVAYFHMPSITNTIRLDELAAGNELTVGTDIFFGDRYFDNGQPKLSKEKLNTLYNGADLVLCTDLTSSWPFTMTEAMAAGIPVAGPNEHVWLDVVDNDRGIALPTSQFTWAPWDTKKYVRTISAAGATDIILDKIKTDKIKDIQLNGTKWARFDNNNNSGVIANAWLKLFGVI